MKTGWNSHFKELLFAMESARSRLAVTMAAESKSTPLERRQYYLETSDRMRRCLKMMRKKGWPINGKHQEWLGALEILRRLPIQSEADSLCRILHDIVAQLTADL